MAQPVFDGHPLEQYFQDTGEFMPGRSSKRMEEACYFVFNMLESFFASNRTSRRTKAFAERFKYGVISSSLLSPPSVEPNKRFSLPGKLPNTHSRTPSTTESTSTTDNISLSMPPEPESPTWPLTLSFTLAIAVLGARFYSIALLLLLATLYYMHLHRLDIRSKPDVMTPSLIALQHLIAAGRLWDTVINDTFTILENEERSIFYGPPSSSLRVALSSTLLTTQTQCDHVRRLLSAITCPSELAQLAEMYAPPSPIKPTFTPTNNSWHRPLSHPGPTSCPTSATDRTRKRSTWNGSYASLAGTPSPSSPSFHLAQRRKKRRSDLNALQQLGTAASPTPARRRSQSGLSSPPLPLLADVSEGEEDGMITAESSLADDDEQHSFGTAALGLYRTHVQGGLRALELSSHSTLVSTMTSATKRPPTTMSPGSKYTRMQTKARHPFALSSLRRSLQSALASKRFACSHLLALRFHEVGGGAVHEGDKVGHSDEGDGDGAETYWEDARAVMGLLTSTLVDAAQRLAEVLEEVEEREVQLLGADDIVDAVHTPNSPPASPPPPPPVHAQLSLSRAYAIDQMTTPSYAPTPSHLARFAAHVDTISTALDDAREQLARCVASLKDEHEVAPSLPHSPSPGHSSHPSTSSSGSGAAAGAHIGAATRVNVGTYGEPADHPAIQAYERLRRELGLALRECERGRERLVSLVIPPTPSTEEEMLGSDAHGNEDEEVQKSKGADDAGLSLTVVSPSGEAVAAQLEPESVGLGLSSMDDDGHDAMMHPFDVVPPGIEQVFEAESDSVGAFNRERSKLSREERIRFVRAQREARERRRDPFLDPNHGSGSSTPSPPREKERWGPSGEVVQELRDVIWKVGERRRKLTAMSLEESQAPLSTPVHNEGTDEGEAPVA